MNNAALIKQVIDAFDKSDTQGILDLVTDDIVWDMVGDKIVTSKSDMTTYLASMGNIKCSNTTVDILILEDNKASASGSATITFPDGTKQTLRYADFYEIANGKIKKMISFPITIKN